MNFKLGFGPMSFLINDILGRYSRDRQEPLMVIASRNQIDANSGYVMTTKELVSQMSPLKSEYLMLCRDHCGPYFLDIEKSLSIEKAIEATKKTIACDIENGFDLMHVDTSRCQDPYRVADKLINFCLRLNPNLKFEFGTEENIGVIAGITKYQEDVKFASQYPNMVFVVAQTGSLTMENRQVGSFDCAVARKLVQFAEQSNVKLKEHNADYLTKEQISLRKDANIHACNIAPQLGVIQTSLILSLANKFNVNSDEFKNYVLNSGKWKKWLINGNDDIKVLIAGHYCFSSDVYKKIEDSVNRYCDFKNELEKEISSCLDLYYKNL